MIRVAVCSWPNMSRVRTSSRAAPRAGSAGSAPTQMCRDACGDGSPYAFDIRLAPEGHPLDRVVIGLQGGGVCFFNEDCSSRFLSEPGLFSAMDDEPPVTGIVMPKPV